MTDRAHQSPTPASFGETLRIARRNRTDPNTGEPIATLTQETLAAELGVRQSAVSAWESGEVYPTFSNVVRLAELLDLDLDDLVRRIAAETESVPA